MKRKEYEKPAMQVVDLQQQQLLLAGSNGGAKSPDSFTPGGDPLSGGSSRGVDYFDDEDPFDE